MKLIAALVTALTLVGFGGAAFAACDQMKRSNDTAQNDERIIPPADTTS